MPNIIGYSLRDMQSFISLTKISYVKDGIGYVISQSIPPGTVINDNSSLEVKLEAKY